MPLSLTCNPPFHYLTVWLLKTAQNEHLGNTWWHPDGLNALTLIKKKKRKEKDKLLHQQYILTGSPHKSGVWWLQYFCGFQLKFKAAPTADVIHWWEESGECVWSTPQLKAWTLCVSHSSILFHDVSNRLCWAHWHASRCKRWHLGIVRLS